MACMGENELPLAISFLFLLGFVPIQRFESDSVPIQHFLVYMLPTQKVPMLLILRKIIWMVF